MKPRPWWGRYADIRSCLAGLMLIALALVGSLAVTSDANAAELSESGARAFADVASCTATADHLLAAVVVDSSGSLRETDPDDARVGAIGVALDSLEQLAASSGESLNVQASLATFGRSYDQLVGWGTVHGNHAATLRQAANQELPGRDQDHLTDYRSALRGAQESLNQRAESVEGSSCKILLWFTDGRLDVDGTGSGAATTSARGELCAPQGLVDGLRGDNIAVIALALFIDDGDSSVTDQDRERLRAIAEGEGNGEACGASPTPTSSANGAYLRADDAGAMRRLFAQAAALIEGATPGLSVACPSDTCRNGRLSIPADRAIGGFRVILESEGSGSTSTLISPDGAVTQLTPGTANAAGSTIVVKNRDAITTVDVRTADRTDGVWTLITDPGATTLVDLYYFWSITLDLTAPEGLVAGESATIKINARSGTGVTVAAEDYASFELTVLVDGTERAARPSEAGLWEVALDIPAADTPAAIRVDATAVAVTTPSGIKLGPVTASTELPTRLPPSYPSVSPTRLDLPAIVGEKSSSSTLTFTGSDLGPTRACIGAQSFEGPGGAGMVQIRPAAECVEIPANATVELDISVATEHAADGRVDGVIPIELVGVDAGASTTVDVPLGVSMIRPVDETTRWALIAVLTLLAAVLAWGAALIASLTADRFRLGVHARVASVPVTISRKGIERRSGRAVLLDPAEDFKPINGGLRLRRGEFNAGGLEFRRPFPWFPLIPVQPFVRDSSGGVVASPQGQQAMLDPEGLRAATQFPGSVGFVVVADEHAHAEGAEIIDGRLVVVIDSPEGVAAVLPDRMQEIAGADWNGITEAITRAQEIRRTAGQDRITHRSESHAAASGRAPTDEDAFAPAGPPGLLDWSNDSAASPARPLRRPTSDEFQRGHTKNHGQKPREGGVSPPPPGPNFWD